MNKRVLAPASTATPPEYIHPLGVASDFQTHTQTVDLGPDTWLNSTEPFTIQLFFRSDLALSWQRGVVLKTNDGPIVIG